LRQPNAVVPVPPAQRDAYLSAMSEPSAFQASHAWKTAFTYAVASAATAVGGLVLYKARLALLIVLGAGLLAISLDHGVHALERGLKLKRGLAVAVILTALLCGLGALCVLVVPPSLRQARELVLQLPTLLARIRETSFYSLLERRFGVSEQLRESVRQAATPPALSLVGGALSFAGGLITLLFLAVFMLVFGQRQVAGLLDQAHPSRRERYERILRKTYAAVGGYTGGVLVICGINAVLTTTFLALVPRLPFFLPLGLLSGSSSLVPYAGPIVTGSLITVFTLITGGSWKALLVGIYFVLYGQLEGNVLAPLIFRRTVHLSPLLTLLAIVFLAELMGTVGAVVAVPLVAAAQVVIRELLSVRREQWLPPSPPSHPAAVVRPVTA
jgi:predicted PurR-regulated permease PerM